MVVKNFTLCPFQVGRCFDSYFAWESFLSGVRI